MLKLAKKRMSGWAVIGAVLFMIVQVMSNLYLPNLTADIVNNGVAKGDIDYIWATGMKMILFALLSILASVGNVFSCVADIAKTGTKITFRRLSQGH